MNALHPRVWPAILICLVWLPAGDLLAQGTDADRGDRVDLDVDEASLGGVLRMLARKYGLSLVVGPEVEGTVSAHFEGVSVEAALESLATAHGFEVRRRGQVIEIVPVAPPGAEEETPEPVPLIPQPDQTRVYPLAYATADEIASSLKVIVEEGAVVANQASRSVVVTAPAGVQQRIDAVIDALDHPRRQVRIEAKIVETVIGDLDALGIDWNIDARLSGAQRPITFPFDRRLQKGIFYPYNNLEGTETNVSTGDFTSTSTNASAFSDQSSFPLANREDFTFGSLDFTSFRAVLQALQQDSDTRIKGQPEITVTENSQAHILVGKTVPVPTYTRNEQYATTTVSGYQEIEVGTSLDVTPRINADGTISMVVTPEVSGILDFTGPFRDLPITFHRRAKTEVTLEPGRTLVIGGLVSERTVERRSQVPLLGSIPLIGELFSYRSTRDEKTDLWIFITPRLVDREADSFRAGGLGRVGDAWLPAAEASRLSRILAGIASRHPEQRALAFDEALVPSATPTECNVGMPEMAERATANDPLGAVRAAALRLLLVRWPERARRTLDQAIDQRDVTLLPVLAAVALEEESLTTRAVVVRAMRRIAPAQAARLLDRAGHAAPDDKHIQRAVIECFDLLESPDVVDRASRALSSRDLSLQRTALRALGHTRSPEAAGVIRGWLDAQGTDHPLLDEAILALRDTLGGHDRDVFAYLARPDDGAAAPRRSPLVERILHLEAEGLPASAGTLVDAIIGPASGRPIEPAELPWTQAQRDRLQAALDVLESAAPPFADLVRRAFPATVLGETGESSHYDIERQALVLGPADLQSWSSFDLAHQLVHEAVLARCALYGMAARGPRVARLAFREQYLALRRLAGDPHPGEADIERFLRKVDRTLGAIDRRGS